MLSILIVNWNTKDLVVECVNSILAAVVRSQTLPFEVVVVDNNSQDGSAAALEGKFETNPKVHIIKAAENLGFAKGCNLAFKHCSGEYILLLNPDSEVVSDSLEKLVDYLKNHPQAGAVGGKITSPGGTIQQSVRKFPDPLSSFLMFTGFYRFLRPRWYLMDDFDYNKEQAVDQVMGACLLTRRSIIEQIGFLDENFWLWYEEVDFCYRIRQAGYLIMYYPEAVFIHHGGRSFSQVSVFARKKIMANSLLYYFKKRWSEKR